MMPGLICGVCNELLTHTVSMPCGMLICRKHTTDENFMKRCTNCNGVHKKNKYYHSLKHYDTFVFQFQRFLQSRKKLEELILEIEAQNDFKYIDEHFEQIYNKIKERKEALIRKIEEHADNLLYQSRLKCEQFKTTHQDLFNKNNNLDDIKLQISMKVDKETYDEAVCPINYTVWNFVERTKIYCDAKLKLFRDLENAVKVNDFACYEVDVSELFGGLTEQQFESSTSESDSGVTANDADNDNFNYDNYEDDETRDISINELTPATTQIQETENLPIYAPESPVTFIEATENTELARKRVNLNLNLKIL